jgi:hypothetical protein
MIAVEWAMTIKRNSNGIVQDAFGWKANYLASSFTSLEVGVGYFTMCG